MSDSAKDQVRQTHAEVQLLREEIRQLSARVETISARLESLIENLVIGLGGPKAAT